MSGPVTARLPPTIGRYRVVRTLGQGAMGLVVLAHDPVLDRDVAIKVLRADLGLDAADREALLVRMRQEARASARVSHPNLVALHDMGEEPDVGLFLVFEYVHGDTLEKRLARGPLGPEAAAKLARELGGGLTSAHELGVLHRDVKPANVILAQTGAKVADFGIARLPSSTLTREGGILGTPAYSAPESIEHGTFSPASDQFSMAVTLWEAIAGHRAFPGDDAVAVAARIHAEEPAPIAGVCGLDPHVDSVLARALAKHPESRFPSCQDFGLALAEALELRRRGALPTLPDARHEHLHRTSRSRSLAWIALGALAGGAVATVIAREAPRAAPTDAAASAAAQPIDGGAEPADAGAPKDRRQPAHARAAPTSAGGVSAATASTARALAPGPDASLPDAAAVDGGAPAPKLPADAASGDR
ncbi:MAG: serine/threonine protein kinase [Polyangiaceae bacterium]|nr:serine/threonine protein kinase [Polyangiaceae bacterium]